jgi:hypothetical protein
MLCFLGGEKRKMIRSCIRRDFVPRTVSVRWGWSSQVFRILRFDSIGFGLICFRDGRFRDWIFRHVDRRWRIYGPFMDRSGQFLPQPLQLRLAPQFQKLGERLLAAAAAVGAEILQSVVQFGEQSAVAEKRAKPIVFFGSEFVQLILPYIAIVNVAQKRLYPFRNRQREIEPSRVDRPHDLQGVSQAFRRDPHAVMGGRVVGTIQAIFVGQQFFKPAQHVEFRTGETVAALNADMIRSGPGLDLFAGFFQRFQFAAASHAVDGFHNVALHLFAIIFEMHEEPGDAGKTIHVGQGPHRGAEIFDLHIFVASVAQLGGDAANGLRPTAELLGLETLGEYFQSGTQTPRGDPRMMHELDIFGKAHTFELFAKLFGLLAKVIRGQKFVTRVQVENSPLFQRLYAR